MMDRAASCTDQTNRSGSEALTLLPGYAHTNEPWVLHARDLIIQMMRSNLQMVDLVSVMEI